MDSAAQEADMPENTYDIVLKLSVEEPYFDPQTTDCTDRDTIDFTTDNGDVVKITITNNETKIPVDEDIPGSWQGEAGTYTIEYQYKGGTTTGTINVVVGT